MECQLEKLPRIFLYNLTRCISLNHSAKCLATCWSVIGSIWLHMSLRGNLCIHKGRFPWITEHDVSHLLVSYLPHLKSEKLYIFIIILIMVAEIYNLSKNSSLSKYTVVYSKLSKVWEQLTFLLKMFLFEVLSLYLTLEEKMTLKSRLHIKYLTRNPKHHLILG